MTTSSRGEDPINQSIMEALAMDGGAVGRFAGSVVSGARWPPFNQGTGWIRMDRTCVVVVVAHELHVTIDF